MALRLNFFNFLFTFSFSHIHCFDYHCLSTVFLPHIVIICSKSLEHHFSKKATPFGKHQPYEQQPGGQDVSCGTTGIAHPSKLMSDNILQTHIYPENHTQKQHRREIRAGIFLVYNPARADTDIT